MRRVIAALLCLLMLLGSLYLGASAEPDEPAPDSGETGEAPEPAEPVDDEESEYSGETGEPEEPEKPEPGLFTDIGGWAEAYIRQAFDMGLMQGVTDTLFAPDNTMTRAMFVTVLYRLNTLYTGEAAEIPTDDCPFTDIPKRSYYTDAVRWANAAGIVSGVSATEFAPSAPCTREQAVALMYRYLKYLGLPGSEDQYLGGFSDMQQLSRYARRPMAWATAVGLITGMTKTELRPQNAMTRAQFAAVSVRLVKYLGGELEAPTPAAWPQPEKFGRVVWMDGTKLDACYQLNGALYAETGDLCQKTGGELSDAGFEYEIPAVTLSLYGHTIRLTNAYCDGKADGEAINFEQPPICVDGSWYLPLDGLNSVLDFRVLDDPDWGEVFYTRVVSAKRIPKGYRVPVLMYHAVGDSTTNELYVSPSSLEEQIRTLQKKGYNFITFEDLEHIDQIKKPVMMTFDDGYRNNYTNLFPILKKYNVKATIFLITNTTGASNYLSAAQIREMNASGLVSFQSHTHTHPFLDTLTDTKLEYELSKSQLDIARMTGKQPFVLCYPTGRATASVKRMAKRYYEYGLHMGGYPYVTGNDPFSIYRMYVRRDTTVEDILKYV